MIKETKCADDKGQREEERRRFYWKWMNNVHKEVLNFFSELDSSANVTVYSLGWCKISVVNRNLPKKDQHKFLLNRIHKFFVIIIDTFLSQRNLHDINGFNKINTHTRASHVVTIIRIEEKNYSKRPYLNKRRRKNQRTKYLRANERYPYKRCVNCGANEKKW